MNTESYIEAFLFVRGEPVTHQELVRQLSLSAEDLDSSLTRLQEQLAGRGIRLMRLEDRVSLTTAPEASTLLTPIFHEEVTRDLGKAGMEVLTLVLYAGPISRKEIDYVRGVSSSATVRGLLLRGLVHRVKSSSGRSFLYRPTADTLSYLGVERPDQLPSYDTLSSELKTLLDRDVAHS